MKNSISIKDISSQAGVSIATVSRIINKNGRYSQETEKRVMDIPEDEKRGDCRTGYHQRVFYEAGI